MYRNNDILWKGLLEEVFDDLLEFVFPGSGKLFDFGRGFEFMDKELAQINPDPGKESETRFVDKLVKVFRRDGGEEWFLVHIEVQGPTTFRMRQQFADRMFRYFYRVFDRYRKPVTGIAIFTGSDGQKMPDRFEYEFLNTRLVYQYNAFSILDFSEKDLEKSKNPFAMVILAAKKSLLKGKDLDGQLLEQKLIIVKLLLKKGFPQKKVRAIMIFLHNYVHFVKSEMNLKFVEEVDDLFGKKKVMGIAEHLAEIRAAEAMKLGLSKGLKEGRKEGRENSSRACVEKLLKDGYYPQEKNAFFANVSLVFVRKVQKELGIK